MLINQCFTKTTLLILIDVGMGERQTSDLEFLVWRYFTEILQKRIQYSTNCKIAFSKKE